MKHITRSYPRVQVDTARSGAVAQAGGVLLAQAAEVTGLTSSLKTGLSRWRKPTATHDPGKILSDLALSLALGGDCLADLALLRAERWVYGKVASEATVSRTVSALAGDANATIRAINTARAAARAQAWTLAGTRPPGHGASAAAPLIIDLDATVVIAHLEKQFAVPTFKRSFGFHPLLAFADHGSQGSGEPLAVLLRPG
ncbi:transposase, partial [Ornithinimicrobium cryptoxanthini]|uniref:transposase n=1 Tax=Ornithinimicrobium cryptoxanthini TaxID=2934161 RepID=UPI002FC8995B